MHFVTKTYGHELGLSACFRQHRAKSHCRFLHGYPLSFKLTFAANELDENGWVIDFGALKRVKQYLVDTFDHKLLLARDDPEFERIMNLSRENPVADVLILTAVGCEAFAKLVWDFTQGYLEVEGYNPRVQLVEIEVREHASNGVIYTGEDH